MMSSLLALRTRRALKVKVQRERQAGTCSPADASRAGRLKVWQMANSLASHCSPWQLEYLKAAIGTAEFTLGYAHLIAESCQSATGDENPVRLRVPPAQASVRTASQALLCRGLAVHEPTWLTACGDRIRFTAAAAAGITALAVCVVRGSVHNPGFTRMDGASGATAFALHGEVSTRTQHLLKHVAHCRPSWIVLVGRLRAPPRAIASEWFGSTNAPSPRLLYPVSLTAILRALPQLASLLVQGWRAAPTQPFLPTLRDHAAIVYRVLLGAAMRQWWKMHGPSLRHVIFGHTGTADTMQLEAGMQAAGVRTSHAVHGLAVGPNFAAFSDAALFRCGFDADQYRSLRTYGRCEVQEASRPTPVRGDDGLYLLTNLAHPMNPGYAARGPEDEIALLRMVAEASLLLRPGGQRMVWRPHPVLRRLPAAVAARVREEARRLGFEEQDPVEPVGPTAAGMRWTVTSPSTTAVDLLAHGALPVVVDLQQLAVHTAPGCFPSACADAGELAHVLASLDNEAAWSRAFDQTWSRVRPGKPLDAAAVEALAR